MKKINGCYNTLTKTVCFFLAVIGLVTALVSAAGIIVLLGMDGYSKDKTHMLREQMETMALSLADDMADMYAQEKYQPDYIAQWSMFYDADEQTNYRYTITNQYGRELTSTYAGEDYLYTVDTEVMPGYLRAWYEERSYTDGDSEQHTQTEYREDWVSLNETWTVTGYVLEDMEQSDRFSFCYKIGGALHDLRYWLIALTVLGLFATLCAVIYLLFAAGRRPGKEEIALNLFDKIPGDVYLAAVIGLTVLACFIFDALLNLTYREFYGTEMLLAVLGMIATVGVLWTAILAFILTVSARLKKGGGYIWRQSIIFWLLRLCWKILKFLWRGVKFLCRGIRRLFYLLPLVWQWLVLGGALLLVFFVGIVNREASIVFAGCVIWIILTVYLAMSFGQLQKHIRAMARGDLDRRVPTRGLHGNFLMMAKDVNSLGAGAEAEVERRMRSERMKTELITNVSHDIKTPLTSIVTYVDLLQKAHTPEETQEYLEVLARQAQRLKKLTEDLVEMSKASSGNMAVNLEKTNIVELIDQALAEYEAKMERATLQVVKRLPEVELTANADGRLFWRVMDNLLGNCVKYAMPGTRVYVDAAPTPTGVVVSVRNISTEALNITADELMERFVRGDRSRNTEGSGLGLNIAKTLMELQHGTLELDVDGDLFKVVLTLKRREMEE